MANWTEPGAEPIWNNPIGQNILYLKGKADEYDAFALVGARKDRYQIATAGGSSPTNINANVTAICALSVTLVASRPCLVTWSGGAIKNTSGITQNIQQRMYVGGVLFDNWSISDGSGGQSIANGATVELASGCWIHQTSLPVGATQFDIRFSVGDGSSSIQFIPNSYNGQGVLSVMQF